MCALPAAATAAAACRCPPPLGLRPGAPGPPRDACFALAALWGTGSRIRSPAALARWRGCFTGARIFFPAHHTIADMRNLRKCEVLWLTHPIRLTPSGSNGGALARSRTRAHHKAHTKTTSSCSSARFLRLSSLDMCFLQLFTSDIGSTLWGRSPSVLCSLVMQCASTERAYVFAQQYWKV